jgi:hypothetical protein
MSSECIRTIHNVFFVHTLPAVRRRGVEGGELPSGNGLRQSLVDHGLERSLQEFRISNKPDYRRRETWRMFGGTRVLIFLKHSRFFSF